MYKAILLSVIFHFFVNMKGKVVKDVLFKNGIVQSELAKTLGLAPNNLNNMLAKDDIRTGLLEDIAKASDIPISVFYGDSYKIKGNNNATGNNNTVNASDDRLLSLLLAKSDQLTMAMNQTSKAQDQTSKAQEQIDRLLDKFGI